LPESLRPERRGQDRTPGRVGSVLAALRRPVLSRLIMIFFLVILAFAAMESIFALWALRQLDWGPEKVGYVFAYLGLLSAIMQGGLTRLLTKRYGEERLLLCGLVLLAIGLVIVPFSHELLVLGGAFALLAVGIGLVQPALNGLISRRAGGGEQGGVLGVTQSVGSLARVLGPPSAGYLFADLGRGSPFISAAVLVVIALVLALNLFGGFGAARIAEPDRPLGRAR
jgi:MFS transporter, DHA1 family, tetracycline resistance protein